MAKSSNSPSVALPRLAGTAFAAAAYVSDCNGSTPAYSLIAGALGGCCSTDRAASVGGRARRRTRNPGVVVSGQRPYVFGDKNRKLPKPSHGETASNKKPHRGKRTFDLNEKRSRRRTCVGCGSEQAAHEMLRFVLGPSEPLPRTADTRSFGGSLVVDLAGKSFGRGVWVHARLECLRAAANRGFSKGFKRNVRVELEDLLGMIQIAAVRRLKGLLGAALRAGHSVFGADSVRERQGEACLVLVAEGAGSLTRQNWLLELGRRGRLVVAGDKQLFGAVCGRNEVAVLALTEPRIARTVASCIGLMRLRASAEAAEPRPVSEV